MKKTKIRDLGAMEQAQAVCAKHFALNGVGVVRLKPGLPAVNLRRALSIVQKRHPLLNVTIAPSGRKYSFHETSPKEIPLDIIEGQNSGSWIELVERRLAERFETHPFMHCTLLKGEGEDHLILCVEHTIMDFVSGASFLNELLDTCDRLNRKLEDTPSPANQFPPSAEELFPKPYLGLQGLLRMGSLIARQLALETRSQGRRPWFADLDPPNRALCRIYPLEFSVSLTRSLIRRTRRSRVTLNSLLVAAMLLTVKQELIKAKSEYLSYITVSNLRPRLVREIGEPTCASYISMMRMGVEVPPGIGLETLASKVNAQTLAALRRGERFTSLLLSPYLMRILMAGQTRRMATVALSLADQAILSTERESFRVVDFHSCVSNFPTGPPCTAQARVWEGKLAMDFVFLGEEVDPARARRLLETFQRIVVNWVDAGKKSATSEQLDS